MKPGDNWCWPVIDNLCYFHWLIESYLPKNQLGILKGRDNIWCVVYYRERDSSPAGMSRKRPSMLSEFQGKHVYSDRDRSRYMYNHHYCCTLCICMDMFVNKSLELKMVCVYQ